MHRLAFLIALALVASSCGGQRPTPRSGHLTVKDVEQAFEAEGVALQQGFDLGPAVSLIPPDGSARYSATVFRSTKGGIGFRRQQKDVIAIVRNVVVAYRPGSPSARHVRAAIHRLRQQT